MAWVDALSEKELRRCIRDLIALSTLPAIWRDYAPQQIAESLAAALLSILNIDFVHVHMRQRREAPPVEVTRASEHLAPISPEAILGNVRPWVPRPPDDVVLVSDPSGSALRVIAAPIGWGGDAVLVVGSRWSDFPAAVQRLLLGIGANEAAIALQRWDVETDQSRFAALVEISSDFVAFASLEGVSQYINVAGLQLLGLSGAQDSAKRSMLDFFTPDDRQRIREEIWPQVFLEGHWAGELGMRRVDTGELIPFLVEWFRIDDPRTGRPMNIATVSRDLRAQRAAQAELRRLNETLEQRVARRTEELAQANRKLLAEAAERERADARMQELQLELFHAARLSTAGHLAAALAHELNQPLAAATISINSVRRLLVKYPATNGVREEILDGLDEASGQALRAGQIIRKLREFVRRGETERRAEAVLAMIEEASTLALSSPDSLGVKVRLQSGEGVSQVLVDRIQIQQVLTNLIRNAVEAMAGSSNGELLITTALVNPQTVQIAVADNGSGLSEEARPRLFEPFVSTKRNGMGLGLSICRSIVEAHGGRLWHEPNPAGGAIFRFTVAAGPQGEEK